MIDFLQNKLKQLLEILNVNNKNNLHIKIINKWIKSIKNGNFVFNDFENEIGDDELKRLTKANSLQLFFKDLCELCELIDDLNFDLEKDSLPLNGLVSSSLKNEVNEDSKDTLLAEKFNEKVEKIQNWKKSFIRNQLNEIFSWLKISNEDELYENLLKAIEKNNLNDLNAFKEEIPPKKFKSLLSAVQTFLKEPKDSYDSNQNLQTETQNRETKFLINDLIERQKMISLMPTCLEKSVLNLIIYSKFKTYDTQILFENGVEIVDSLDTCIAEHVILLKDRFNLECPETGCLSGHLDLITNKINLKDWSSVVSELKKFLKKIRPLDIEELIFLMTRAKQAARLIENQDVILLLGETGSGKSTLTHFLAGSKLIKERIEISPGHFLDHLTAQLETGGNPDLRSVVTSYQAKSETRYINPITVNLKQLGSHENKSYIVCDTPGSGDTAGTEVDIANGFGIIEAIKGCRSVRPVILSSYLKIGDRGEGIRNLAHWLVDMVPDIDDHLSAFSYLFTKYPPDINVYTVLKNIKNSIDEDLDEKNKDELFEKLFVDILEKTENSKSFDPLNESPLKLINKFIRSASIYKPSKAFRIAIKDNSRAILNEQLRMHQQSVIYAAARGDYLLIERKLYDLKFLSETLSDQLSIRFLNECLSFLSNSVNKKYEEIVQQFNSCLENQNKMLLKDISYYKTYSEELKQLDCFKSFESLKAITGLHEALIQNLKIKLKDLTLKLKVLDMKSLETKTNLDNMKLIASIFPETEFEYSVMCIFFVDRLKYSATETGNELKTSNFEKVSEQLQSTHKSISNLKDHLASNETEVIRTCLIDSVFSHLSDTCKSIDDILESKDVENLRCCLKTLEDAKEKLTNRKYIQTKQIVDLYEQAVSKVIRYFDNLNKKVNDLFDEPSKPFQQMEILVKEMQNIRSLPEIEARTSERYHATIQGIIGCMQQIKIDAEILLNDFRLDKDNKNFNKLFRCLTCLKNAEWIDGHKQGVYEEIMKNIKIELIQNSSAIYEEINDLDLYFLNSENFEKCFELVQKLENMKIFEASVSDLENYRKISLKKFHDSLNANFDKIKNSFSSKNDNQANNAENDNNQVIQSKQFNQIDLEYAELAYKFLQSCSKIKRLREQTNLIKKNFENYFSSYKEYIDSTMNSCFDQIESLSDENSDLSIGLAQQIKFCLQDLKEVEKYKSINQLVNSAKISHSLAERLNNHLITLADQLNNDSGENINLKNKLVIVKALSQLDSFVANEKKYFDLYRKYQEAVRREFRDFYVTIINNIEKHEYKNVSTELMVIEEFPVNENALNKIKSVLTNSIVLLLDLTRNLAIRLGNTLDLISIEAIVVNLNKLESAKMHISTNFDVHFSKNQALLDAHTQDRLTKGVDLIQYIISKKITKFLENIEALISLNHFYDAEKKLDHLNNVRNLLGNYCITEETTNKNEEIEKKLEGIVDTLLEDFKRMTINDYLDKSPKYVIEQLEKVASSNLRYGLALSTIKSVIKEKLVKTLSDAKHANSDERNANLLLLESIKLSLPIETKVYLEAEVENLRKYLDHKEQDYELECKNIISSTDASAISNFMERCTNDGMYKSLRLAQEAVLKLINELKIDLLSSLEEDNIETALEIFKKLINFKNMLGKRIKELDSVLLDTKKKLVNKIIRITSSLNEIATEENPDKILHCFKSGRILIEFKAEIETNNENSKSVYDLDDFFLTLENKFEAGFAKICEFFSHIQSKYEVSICECHISNLNESLTTMKKWDPLLSAIRKFISSANETLAKPFAPIETIKTSSQMIKDASTLFKNLKHDVLNFQLINCYDIERDQFYKNLSEKIVALKNCKALKIHLDCVNEEFNANCYEKDIYPFLTNKFLKAKQIALSVLENEMSKKDLETFRLNYDNLIAFEKYAHLCDLDLSKYLDEINSQMQQKLNILQGIVETPDSPIQTVAVAIINMKTFADNLPIFNEQINERIDNVLKNYSSFHEEERGIALSKLSVVLENDVSGIGLSVISEHKIFKGQAISLFNQEAQRHDINHILKNLDGDFINKELLHEQFEDFENNYKKLVKDNLNRLERSTDNESTLNDLVRKIKMLPRTLRNKKNFEIWDSKDREVITDLISHIFALWTLSNTDYFNEMKGVENRNSFLLTPHPGQVVSIFRLLGIGYGFCLNRVFKKDGLQNNLVQVGTGEGKSLILAVTSCILVLIGMEVSCACYSEYLSSRDYESFANIFNSLGVEQKIHYGTFNKVCENIINEKGDIRSRVVTLISSKSSLKETVPVISSHKETKVLLIDEVDIFFNQDFYGNIYTPLGFIFLF